MNNILLITLIGLGAGVIGTGSGAVIALFVKAPSKALLGFMLGFAGGIMLAIVLADLLPESVEIGGFMVAFAGLLIGSVFILVLDLKIPHFHLFEATEELARYIRTGTILGLGIAMHNLPALRRWNAPSLDFIVYCHGRGTHGFGCINRGKFRLYISGSSFSSPRFCRWSNALYYFW